MSNAPYPGGCEEKYLEDKKRAMQESENDDEVKPTPSRTRFNAFVSFFRSREAIRVELVMAAKNYMTQRINIEQEELIQKCITLLSAKTMNDFVSHGITIVRMLFPGEVEQFSDDVCNYLADDTRCWILNRKHGLWHNAIMATKKAMSRYSQQRDFK